MTPNDRVPKPQSRRAFLGQAAAVLAGLTARPVLAQPAPTPSLAEIAADPVKRKARRQEAIAAIRDFGVLRSGDVIRYIAKILLMGRDEIGAILDAFWRAVEDPAIYQGSGKRGHFLVVPHFGTFFLQKGRLAFFSRKRSELDEFFGRQDASPAAAPTEKKNPFVAGFLRIAGAPNARWIRDHQAGKTGRLSVKRRIAVLTCQKVKDGAELPAVDAVLWEFFHFMGRVFAMGNHTIRWSRRGCLEFQDRYDRYRYRPYRRTGKHRGSKAAGPRTDE